MRRDRLLARAPLLPQPRDLLRRRLEAAEGVEQRAVGGGIDQRAVVVLAVDLDQRGAERSAAPARSPAGR